VPRTPEHVDEIHRLVDLVESRTTRRIVERLAHHRRVDPEHAIALLVEIRRHVCRRTLRLVVDAQHRDRAGRLEDVA
jgi:hypothetical protein